jgi:diguanylate cyclase (GGDEF)-like protein
LLVAFIDVDELRSINNSRGHAAGDRMLVEVVEALRTNLRPYDVILRFGGDEFLCVCPGLEERGASLRFSLVNAILANKCEHGSVTVGLAELRQEETAAEFIARADRDLYKGKHKRRSAS